MAILRRRLGMGRAIVIGLASMIGAGVFFVWAPAADAAGSALLVGLLIAAIVATLNALSSAQLAMAYPVSGGAYSFGRATVGPWTGFTAGWLFLAGKTASAGAIALIAGSYLWPEQARPVAVAGIATLAGVNMTGIRSTARVSAAVVTVVLAGLAGVVVATLAQAPEAVPLDFVTSPYGVLQSAGLLFFAFAGYARMATLGEEVVNPRRTLPRAIVIGLAIALLVYGAIGLMLLMFVGAERLAGSASPLAELLSGPGEVVVRVVAVIASLGSLLAILAGLSRTSLAMARERDLPGALSRISSRTHAPVVAEAIMAVLAIVGIVLLDPARLVGFSSCAVLVYYAIAHLSALRQPAAGRWLPRAVQWVGLLGCVTLAVTLPWRAVALAAVVLALGLALRAVAVHRRAP